MRMDEKLRANFIASGTAAIERFADDDMLRDCEVYGSPLEYAFALAFVAMNRLMWPGAMKYRPWAMPASVKAAGDVLQWLHEAATAHTAAVAVPQIEIGPYRVDFFIGYRDGTKKLGGLVVEIDGHDFHEKTKEQVERDKARDRYLQGCGFHVLRFPGSEVWRDPFWAAVETIAIVRKFSGEEHVTRWPDQVAA